MNRSDVVNSGWMAWRLVGILFVVLLFVARVMVMCDQTVVPEDEHGEIQVEIPSGPTDSGG
jgi:hypothetical protein